MRRGPGQRGQEPAGHQAQRRPGDGAGDRALQQQRAERPVRAGDAGAQEDQAHGAGPGARRWRRPSATGGGPRRAGPAPGRTRARDPSPARGPRHREAPARAAGGPAVVAAREYGGCRRRGPAQARDQHGGEHVASAAQRREPAPERPGLRRPQRHPFDEPARRRTTASATPAPPSGPGLSVRAWPARCRTGRRGHADGLGGGAQGGPAERRRGPRGKPSPRDGRGRSGRSRLQSTAGDASGRTGTKVTGERAVRRRDARRSPSRPRAASRPPARAARGPRAGAA